MTFFSTSYGSALSPMTVISRSARSFSVICWPTSVGRFSASRSGPMMSPSVAWISATVAIGSPCTNSSSRVSITTTVWRGGCSAIDCGISIALVFCSTSTLVEYTSRNDTMTLRISIIGIRLSSASARWRIWGCNIRRARFDMLMRGLRSWIAGRSRGRRALGHHRGVADRDVRKQFVLHHVEPRVDLEHADPIHHLHHDVVRRVVLEQDGGIGL